MRFVNKNFLLSVSLLACVAGSASGVEPDGIHVSDIAFNEENWSYVPLVTVTSGAQASNIIFAVDRNYATKPDKIVCVLYIRDAAADGGWAKKATWSADPWAAVQSLSDAYGIPQDEVYRWGVRPLSSGTAATVTFENYADGVFADDQFAALTTDPFTHDMIVSSLEATTYKSADVPLERAASGCGSSAKLDSIAGAAASYAFSVAAETRSAAQFVNAGLAAGGCAGSVIVPIRTKPMGPAKPWGPVICAPDWMNIVHCRQYRKQKFLRMRTCAYGTPTVYCDQWTIIDCEEEGPSCITPTVLIPCPPPPPPATPNIPLGPDDGYGTPDNCENQGWTGTNPQGCTCP
jgi:hypothetical protein